MRILVVAAQKDGAGKTTLARNLAVAAAHVRMKLSTRAQIGALAEAEGVPITVRTVRHEWAAEAR
jgi:Mrp family chromosome partitioning ATPase